MARDSEVNADKLGNEASAVFVVRSGSISRQGGELELRGALEDRAQGLQGTQRIHCLEKPGKDWYVHSNQIKNYDTEIFLNYSIF